jgi:hypothetical protein
MSPIRVAVQNRVRLTDHGHDGARDQIPFRADMQRHDRLNVAHFLGSIEWSSIEIGVALKWNANEISDWVLRFLR